MCTRSGALFGAILIFGLGLLITNAHGAPSIEAYGRLPMISDVEISPDGKRIAMLQSVEGKTVVTVYTVGAPPGTKPVAINPSEGKIRDVAWANNERLLIWLSTTWTSVHLEPRKTYELERVMSIKADATDLVFLFRDDDFRYVVGPPAILSLLPDDPEHILMMQLDMELPRSRVTVFKVNVNTGREKRSELGAEYTGDWIIDPQKRVRVRIDYGNKIVVHKRDGAEGRFQQIAKYDKDDKPEGTIVYYGFRNDPNQLYVTARKRTDRRGVYTFDLKTGQLGNSVFLHDKYDVTGVIKDIYTDKVTGVVYVDHMLRTTYFDPKLASLQKKLKAAFKGKSVSIGSMSRNGNSIILQVYGPGEPVEYYFFDAAGRHASLLGRQYPGIQPGDLGQMKPLSYQARDGLTIPAYLTLPPAKEAKKLPLVVLPHGGPESRDSQGFDWWAQFYAGRGYAVLQPNFRGSSGYGKDYVKKGHGEWGGKMQDDLTDGVKHLIAEGIVDPDRVCIVGASYGGYAALAGAAFTPELYACAVSIAGVSDLVTFVGEAKTGTSDNSYSTMYWELWLGPRIAATDEMIAKSPAKHADKVQAPVLLIHGKDDTVVNFYQSKQMADALRKAGKPYKLISLDGEDHWLTQADSRIRILKESEAFLKEHIGN